MMFLSLIFDQGVHEQLQKCKHTLQLVHQGLGKEAQLTEKEEMKS